MPFEEYQLQGEHARGGLGRIIKARDRLGRIVAVKELLQLGDRAQRRFEREARLTARLQHPSIVPIHEAGRWPSGAPFYAMKLVAGRSLKEEISQKATLMERMTLLPNVIAVAEAIAYAHGQRVVHRDLKPSNVLVGDFGETVVVDWGLAKDLAAPSTSDDPLSGPYRDRSDEGLTQDGAVLGTPAYMPPEQAAGDAVDERADVYSLGALLYHVLTGAPPYTGANSAEILHAVSTRKPVALSEKDPSIPPDLAAIVEKAMSRDKESRYPSAAQLANDLRQFQMGQLVSSHHYTWNALARRWILRHRLPVAIVTLAAAALIALGIASITRIVQERSIAEAERAKAERKQVEAETARSDAERRSRALVFANARGELFRDPTRTVAWLNTLVVQSFDWFLAQNIAADAFSRGVASEVIHAHRGGIIGMEMAGTLGLVASVGNMDGVRVTDLKTGRAIYEHAIHAQQAKVATSASGRFVAHSTDGDDLVVWEHGKALVHVESGFTAFGFVGEMLILAPRGEGLNLWDPAAKGVVKRLAVSFDTPVTQVVASAADGVIWARTSASVYAVDVRSGRSRLLVSSAVGVDMIKPIVGTSNLVVLDADGAVRIIEGETGRLRVARTAGAPVADIATSRDGRFVAIATHSSVIYVESATAEATEIPFSGDVSLTSVAISPSGTTLVAGDAGGRIHTYGLQDGVRQDLVGQKGMVLTMRFATDSLLVSGAMDGTIRLWRLSGAVSSIVMRRPGGIGGMKMSPDGSLIAAAGTRGEIQLYDSTRRMTRELRGQSGSVSDVEFSPDGHHLASASSDGSILIWSLQDVVGTRIGAHTKAVWDIRFLSSKLLVSAGSDGRLVLWDINLGTRTELGNSLGELVVLAIGPGGQRFAAGDSLGTVRVWSAKGKPEATLETAGDVVRDVVFLPTDGVLIVGYASGVLKAWNIRDGSNRVLTRFSRRIRGVAVSSLGGFVACSDDGRVVYFADLDTTPVFLDGHEDTVRDVVFSSDGRLLASASYDRSIRVWHLETKTVRVLREHADGVTQVVFSPGGERLFSSSWDGTVREWTREAIQIPATEEAQYADWVRSLTNISESSYLFP